MGLQPCVRFAAPKPTPKPPITQASLTKASLTKASFAQAALAQAAFAQAALAQASLTQAALAQASLTQASPTQASPKPPTAAVSKPGSGGAGAPSAACILSRVLQQQWSHGGGSSPKPPQTSPLPRSALHAGPRRPLPHRCATFGSTARTPCPAAMPAAAASRAPQ